MRHLFAVVWIFSSFHFGPCLAAEESRDAKPAVSDLIKHLGDADSDEVCAAARELGRRRSAKEAIPALKGLLKKRSGQVKLAAAEALWRLKHSASDLVPVYVDLLTASDADVRAASAWRLGRLGSDAGPAVPVLAAALRDESFEVRVQVGQALANLGDLAEPALPALVRALGDERLDEDSHADKGWESARQSPALPALVELGEKAIPRLIETFRESATRQGRPDDLSRPLGWQVAARVSHAFPAFGKQAVPPLLRALKSKDGSTRRYAAVALREVAQFNGLSDDAVEKLEGCMDDPDKGARAAAAEAVSWVRPPNAKAVTVLAKSREEGYGPPIRELLAHLERISPHNKAARKLLLKTLGDEHAETAREAHRILAGLELPADQVLEAWTKALSHADAEVRRQAISALGKLGPGAKSAKAALGKRLAKETDYYCKAGILDALTAIDPADSALVPLLVKSVDDPESWVRYRAVNCLAELGPRAKDALADLEGRLVNPKAKVGRDGLDSSRMRDLVTAVVRIAPGSDKTAATLLKALRNPDVRAVHCPKNTWHMRERLEDELLAALPAATPLLREALKDKDIDVRRSAALVLLRVGLETKTALPVLTEGLWGAGDSSRGQSGFQWRAVVLLSRRRSVTTEAVAAAWCKAWPAAHPEERTQLEMGLLVLQPEALPHLLGQLREAKDAGRKRDLARLLARFEGQGKAVVPILREDLRGRNLAGQYAAAQALALLGPDAADAVPELVKLLGSEHPAIRAVAARSLSGVGRAAKPAVPALKAMLKGSDGTMRVVAAGALARIDPTVSEALALLRDELVSEKRGGGFRPEIRRPEGVKGDPVFLDSVEECIERFGERAVPALADILDDTGLDEWSADNVSTQCGALVRVRAALLLAKLGPDAHKAVPALTRALSDRDPFVRDAAASALGRVGPAAKEAAPACIKLVEQQNRLGSAGGAWDSSTRAGVGSRGARHSGYGGPFDFRSLGRGKALSRFNNFGYGYDVDPYGDVRPAHPFEAARVLSRIDAKECSALSVLEKAAKDPDHPSRLAAALSIWRCGRESPDLIKAFTAALDTNAGDANVGEPLPREARDCLAELGTELKPALGAMADWLKRRQSTGDKRDLADVLGALGHLGPDAKGKADLIRPMLRGDWWQAKRRVAAALALFRISGDRDQALRVLREVLLGREERASLYYRPDLSDTARVHAARALGALAEKDDARARALVVETARGDENPYVRVAALEAAARLKDDRAAAVKGLCAALRHRDAGVRHAAASSCRRLGPLAKASEKALKVASEDGDIAVRQAARHALDLLD